MAAMMLGDDGWPLRSSVEAAWRQVIAGGRTRESVHDWSVPWVERIDVGRPGDSMVMSGLQYLHGLDMTAGATAPGGAGPYVAHGGPDPYLLSDREVATGLNHWLGICREYDDDPAGFVARRLEAARRYRDEN
jgi:hypothetical protein